MTQTTTSPMTLTIGLDLGDRKTHLCALDERRAVVVRKVFTTTRKSFEREFGGLAKSRVVLEAPRVTRNTKPELLRRALTNVAPESFIRFLAAVVKRGRQGLIGAIARQYLALLDIKFGRVHASVVVAREADLALQDEIGKRLEAVLGQEVIPHLRHDPAILGGIVVRVGDRVMDGSLRRRLKVLRKAMLSA